MNRLNKRLQELVNENQKLKRLASKLTIERNRSEKKNEINWMKIKKLENHIFTLNYKGVGEYHMNTGHQVNIIRENEGLHRRVYEMQCELDGRRGIYEREEL